jgi:hypothetical protein
MTGSMLLRVARMSGALLALTAVFAVTAGTASATVIYNNTPAPKEKNYPSVGFEATSTSEFGGQVAFAPGYPGLSSKVTVTMSSWACGNLEGGTHCKTTPGATFPWTITLKVYNVEPNNEPGTEVTSATDENYPIPYRPSANGRCPVTSEGVVGWSPPACFSGKAFKVKFTLNPLIKLPAKAIVSVAYDTTNYGYGPHPATNIGEDSLNVALTEASPTKGTSPLQATGELYVNSESSAMYGSLSANLGRFALANEWEKYQPIFEITGSAR